MLRAHVEHIHIMDVDVPVCGEFQFMRQWGVRK